MVSIHYISSEIINPQTRFMIANYVTVTIFLISLSLGEVAIIR